MSNMSPDYNPSLRSGIIILLSDYVFIKYSLFSNWFSFSVLSAIQGTCLRSSGLTPWHALGAYWSDLIMSFISHYKIILISYFSSSSCNSQPTPLICSNRYYFIYFTNHKLTSGRLLFRHVMNPNYKLPERRNSNHWISVRFRVHSKSSSSSSSSLPSPFNTRDPDITQQARSVCSRHPWYRTAAASQQQVRYLININ